MQTRLVAAERVTGLHRKLALTQAELERANLELLEQSRTDEPDRSRQPPPHGGGPRPHPCPGACGLGRTYGVALFDIDHFKCYNDHYGHVGGDEALRRVATCIDLVVRAGECAYRYGGEEFLLLMPDCQHRRFHLRSRRTDPPARRRGGHPARRPAVGAAVRHA